MHASVQPGPRVPRTEFINQLSAPFTADSAPAGNILWETVQKIFFTIDDEGLYDEPIVHAVGEIARALGPITFQ